MKLQEIKIGSSVLKKEIGWSWLWLFIKALIKKRAVFNNSPWAKQNNEEAKLAKRLAITVALYQELIKKIGKQKAFECLVYLHRYNESTLSRMRSSYVTPLQGNISARIEFLDHEKDSATNASSQKKIQKQIDVLKKKQVELQSFDDELRHYADMRISLDLDDGVKVNYEKFGNLLAEKKAITGK